MYIHGWTINRDYRSILSPDTDRMVDIPVISIYGFNSAFYISLKRFNNGYLFGHLPLSRKKTTKPTRTYHKSFHEAVKKFKTMIRRKDPHLSDDDIRAMVDVIYNIARFEKGIYIT